MKEIGKEKPKKKAQVLHSTRLTDAGEIVVECAIPVMEKSRDDMQITDYQLGVVNLGKPTRNQQMSLIDIVASSTKSRMIKGKQRKDELNAQLDQLHRFLKDVSSPISQQAALPESPVLLTKKEADDLVQMKSKVGMMDKWLDKLN